MFINTVVLTASSVHRCVHAYGYSINLARLQPHYLTNSLTALPLVICATAPAVSALSRRVVAQSAQHRSHRFPPRPPYPHLFP